MKNSTPEELILRTIDRWEGGLSNEPIDRGGFTRWGISRLAYPDLDIHDLTKSEAVAIYLRDYYKPLNLSGVNNVCLRWKVLDLGINLGSWRAAKYLQGSVGVKADGIIGPITLQAVNLRDPKQVMFSLIEKQAKHYARIMAVNNRQAKFALGWIRRAFDKGEDLR